jgi:signal transduction histidine kinase
MLIQDAAADPQLAGSAAVAAGLTRYLGVPIFSPAGDVIGTLCFLDGRSGERLGPADIEFLSLLAMRVSAELERERVIEGRVAEEHALVVRLERANAQLRRADEEKRRFIAAVIHDLRQPLTAMRTMVHLLRSEQPEAERSECLDFLNERLIGMGEMLNELLEYARIQAGQVPWRLEATNLRLLLNQCLDGFASEAAGQGVALCRELDPDLGESRTDRTRLCHIVGNLVANAIKFSARAEERDGPGRVIVRACSEGPASWRLEVEDNGIGMVPAEVERIFDEFYQGSQARASEARAGYAKGLGLGLSIVRHLGEAMGGCITVRSAPGAGTCFALTFPRDYRPEEVAGATERN